MTKNVHVCALCFRPEVVYDISGQNVKTIEGYIVVHFEVDSSSSFRHFVTAGSEASADIDDSIKRKRFRVSLILIIGFGVCVYNFVVCLCTRVVCRVVWPGLLLINAIACHSNAHCSLAIDRLKFKFAKPVESMDTGVVIESGVWLSSKAYSIASLRTAEHSSALSNKTS